MHFGLFNMTDINNTQQSLKKVLVIGASGLTGKALVNLLMREHADSEIHLLLRTKMSLEAKNLYQHIVDFNNIEIFDYLFQCNIVFCCLGTTLKKAKTKENFKAVDVDLVVKCAQLSCAANVEKLIVISALGANSNAWNFYNQCKGNMQHQVVAACTNSDTQAVFCQPSLLLGERKEHRSAERFSAALSNKFHFIWHGFMKKYQPIAASQLAKAMLKLAVTPNIQSVIYVNNKELHRLSNNAR